MTRIALFVIAAFALGLSACTNSQGCRPALPPNTEGRR